MKYVTSEFLAERPFLPGEKNDEWIGRLRIGARYGKKKTRTGEPDVKTVVSGIVVEKVGEPTYNLILPYPVAVTMEIQLALASGIGRSEDALFPPSMGFDGGDRLLKFMAMERESGFTYTRYALRADIRRRNT